MNSRQEGYENMLIQVDHFGDEYATVLNANQPAITPLRAIVKDFLARLATERGKQLTPSQGVTLNKEDARKTLIDAFLYFAGPVYAFGVAKNDNIIKEAANFKLTSLYKMTSGDLLARCQALSEIMINNAEELETGYAITMLKIEEFIEKRNAFDELKGTPEGARDHIEVATEQIEDLIKDSRTMLTDQYDRLMQSFKTINSIIYDHYKTSRKIDDPRTTPTKLKGNVKDVDGNPLSGVSITFVNDLFNGSATSNGEGQYETKARLGFYTVTATKAGFLDLTVENYRIKLGKINHLDFEMTPA